MFAEPLHPNRTSPLGILLLSVFLCVCSAIPAAEGLGDADRAGLLKQAEKGDAKAQFQLGLSFEYGLDGPRDPEAAALWYEKSATQGNLQAQNNLGVLYVTGRGVERDYAMAREWLKQAAEAGNAEAMNNLGWMYLQGWGSAKDYDAARKWIEEAARQGNSSAENNLGLMHQNGWGFVRNFNRAAEWFTKSAQQGNSSGQVNLGVLHLRGHGVPQSRIEAYKWFSIAAAQGDKRAANYLENVGKELTPGDVAEAQRQAAKFEPRRKSPGHPSSSDALRRRSFGTGFFITPDGHLLTCLHVIDGAAQVLVKKDGKTLAADVVRIDRVNDLALLKVPGEFEVLPLASSRSASLGESVFTLGFPNPEVQGVAPKLTRGEINSLAGEKDDPRYFQVSVEVQPGSSGGPLIDKHGRVIGLMSNRLRDIKTLKTTGFLPQNVNYAIKGSYALAFLEVAPFVMEDLFEPETSGKPGFKDAARQAEAASAMVVAY